MNQLEAAEKYGITHEQVYSIDNWFLQSPMPLKDFPLHNSLPFMSNKLNLSKDETLELLQDRRDSVMRTLRLNKIFKNVFFLAVGAGIYYLFK